MPPGGVVKGRPRVHCAAFWLGDVELGRVMGGGGGGGVLTL